MANIFVNGLKSKTGGGKNILRDFIDYLVKTKSNHNYFVLTPNYEEFIKYSTINIKIININSFLHKNAMFLFLYRYALPRALTKYQIEIIFNLGDIIIPSNIPQIYLFDWAYAVYPESIVWEKMNKMDSVMRIIKRALIKKYINYPSIIIAQTNTIRRRLETQFNLSNIVTIPNTVSQEVMKLDKRIKFNFPLNKRKLLYLTNYAPHKNIEILLTLANLILLLHLPYCIILTIDPKSHKNAERIIGKINAMHLESIIYNIGTIDSKYIASLYGQCDALLMPTLLESYGLPYIEAMYHSKTILTSDFDFAKDVCKEAAYYFDPFDAESILNTINIAFSNEVERKRKIAIGLSRIRQLLTWPQVFSRYQELINTCAVGANL